MSSMSPIRARFVGGYMEVTADGGDGTVLSRTPVEFLPGIPARDLTEEDYQALTVEQRAAVRASPLYDAKTDAEMRPAIRRAERAAPATDTEAASAAGRASAGGND